MVGIRCLYLSYINYYASGSNRALSAHDTCCYSKFAFLKSTMKAKILYNLCSWLSWLVTTSAQRCLPVTSQVWCCKLEIALQLSCSHSGEVEEPRAVTAAEFTSWVATNIERQPSSMVSWTYRRIIRSSCCNGFEAIRYLLNKMLPTLLCLFLTNSSIVVVFNCSMPFPFESSEKGKGQYAKCSFTKKSAQNVPLAEEKL